MGPQPRRCPACGKLTFATRAQAEEAAYRLQHDHGGRLNPYEEHGAWHLSSESQRRPLERGRKGQKPGRGSWSR